MQFMTRNPAATAIPAFLLLLVLALPASGARPPLTSFVADKVVMDSSGRITTGERITMAGEKIRAESLTGDMVMLFRHDLGLLWVLAPEKRIYVEIPLDEGKWDRVTRGSAEGDQVRVLGTETVSGFPCTVKEVARTRTVMGRRTTSTRTVCSSDRIGMVLRSRTGNGYTTELRDIRPATPADNLFGLPAGYRKVGNNMGLLLMYMRGANTGPPTRIH